MPPSRSTLRSLLALFLPEELEKVYADVEAFVAAHTHGDAPRTTAQLAGEVKRLITHFGEPVRPALRALLCDQTSSLHATLETALACGTKSAIALLVPMLITQFALAPAAALFVAALVVKALATRGRERLCAELAQPSRPRGRRRTSAATGRPRRSAAQPGRPQPRGARARPKAKARRPAR